MPWHQLLIWSSSMLRKSWNQPELTVNIQKIILESFNLFKPKHILTCMFSIMFLSSQATFPKSYCGGSDFCRSVGPSRCCGLLDNILHPEFGCWSYKAGSVAAEGHLCHRHVWIDSQRHWILCRNHSDKTSGPGLCLFPVRNRYNICKAR